MLIRFCHSYYSLSYFCLGIMMLQVVQQSPLKGCWMSWFLDIYSVHFSPRRWRTHGVYVSILVRTLAWASVKEQRYSDTIQERRQQADLWPCWLRSPDLTLKTRGRPQSVVYWRVLAPPVLSRRTPDRWHEITSWLINKEDHKMSLYCRYTQCIIR